MGARTFINWIFTSAGKLGEQLPFSGGTDKEQIKQKVDSLIGENNVMIFSKSISPHCHRAKKIFDELNQKYGVVELNKLPREEMSAAQDVLNEMTGARTVPRVFVNGKCIGGGAETAELLEKGELQQLVGVGGSSSGSS